MGYEPGHQIGSLRVERELGRGAYGVVYLASDTLLGRPVALKSLTAEDGAIPEERRQEMLAEARLVGNLKSPHIVTLFRLHESEDGGLLQEMEFVDGGALEDRLTDGASLPVDDALRIFRGVAAALRTAHASRVVHGDIKPANVLFGEDGTVKLADFGLARMLEEQAAAAELHGRMVGSPFYMAPEVISGRETGMAADVWSLAVVLYRVLSGRLPFPAEQFAELAMKVLREEPEPLDDDVPPAASALLSRCLAKSAADRPTVEEVLDELDRMAEESGGAPAEVARERKTNLPPAYTSFVGRSSELQGLSRVVESDAARLVTVTGPGGIGKTRLTQELCRTMADALPGGAWFAELAEEEDAEGIAHAVAEALGLQPGGEGDLVEFVAGVLQYREPMLLVLDNFEQVIRHAAETVGVWLARAPQVRFVVTSRALLLLDGERRFGLESLAAPAPDGGSPDEMLAFSGVQLFVDRAREADSGFTLLDSNAGDVARIVRELEGIPLAIELAAARTRIMQPKRIAENLGRKFQLLRSSRLDVSVRQKTLEGAIEWSFDLLDPHEREAYLQACWFRDGFGLDAADEVIALRAEGAPEVGEVVRSLKAKSLLNAWDAGPEIRLGMYRSIREYGEKRAREAFDDEVRADLTKRHADHYLALADRWNAFIPGPRDQEALDRISLEIGNLGAVIDRAAEDGEGEAAARAALGLAETLKVRRPPKQLATRLEEALAVLGDGAPGLRARLLTYLSVASRMSGDWDRAVSSADDAVTLARSLPESPVLAEALVERSEIRRNRGELPDALEGFTEAETVARKVGATHALTVATGGRGMVLGQQRDFDAAFDCFREAEFLARQVGDNQVAALQLTNEGVIYESRADLEEALRSYREAEDLSRRMGNLLRLAVSLGAQGNVLAQAGRLDESLRCYLEAEKTARDLGAKQRIGQIVGNRGSVHLMRGELPAAAACLEEAESVARDLGDKRRLATTLGQRGRILEKVERREEALPLYAEAEEVAREAGDMFAVARAVGDRGGCLGHLDRIEEAREALEEALRIYDEIHANQSLWYFAFQATLAFLEKDAGDLVKARRLASACLALAGRLGVDADHPEQGEDVKELRKILAL